MTDMITDYITGRTLPDTGSEANRQMVETYLVDQKGYALSDIRIDEPITVEFKGEPYISSLDLIVFCQGKAAMAFKCVAGSIGSYQREILAGARLIYDYQIPFAVSTDGNDAVILETCTGKQIGQGMGAIYSRDQIRAIVETKSFEPLPANKKEREMILFRSFNLDKTNR